MMANMERTEVERDHMGRTTDQGFADKPAVEPVRLMPGSRAYELMQSKNPADHKMAKRLQEYCRKAEACFYEYHAVQKLRKEFQDVL